MQKERDLWHETVSQDALREAWYKVKANKGSRGGDGVTIGEFSKNLFANLTQLRAELLEGSYRSSPFRKVAIPKKKPGYRILTIPSIRDRVVHGAIAATFTPIFEPLFEDGSFAYRPNRGVKHAVARIEKWRNQGYNIVIEADIVGYFNHIDHELLMTKLKAVLASMLGGHSLLALVHKILEAQGTILGTKSCGLVQGSPLSPILANIYLDTLDEEIEGRGVKIVRFADDFVILCKSQKKAEKALKHCVAVLNDHHLQLHEGGTKIVNFEKGFDFIGYLFLKTLAIKEKTPPVVQTHKPIKSQVTDEGIIDIESNGSRYDPGLRTLYIVDPNHHINVRNQSFSIQRHDGSEIIALPHKRIGRIEIGSHVSFSDMAIRLAMKAQILLTFVDGYGQTKAYFTPIESKKSSLFLAQAEAIMDEEMKISLAKKLVYARIYNQRVQLMRLNRMADKSVVAKTIDALQRYLKKLDTELTIEQLRGIEGAATALYWPSLFSLKKGGIASVKRQRPARNSMNAVINYCCGILERDIRASIQQANLLPGLAYLHASKNNHDGLVYDLMEPFRAALTEGTPIFLFNANRLREDMFSQNSFDMCDISKEGIGAIIKGYESAVARRISQAGEGRKYHWRAMMAKQARSLAKAVIQKDNRLFTPYLMDY